MRTVGDQLLLLVGDPQVDPQTREALVALAKPFVDTTATLVTKARYTKSNDGLPTQA